MSPGPAIPLVYAIVLNWNRRDATLACLASLDGNDYPNVKVVVVDNGSSDGSEAAIRAARPDVELLQTGSNLGYAGGNNAGIRLALTRRADYVWILNNDVEVEPFALRELVSAAEADPRAAVLASRHVKVGDGEHFAVALRRVGKQLLEVRCDGCALRPYHAADELMGASLLIRVAALQRVGIFDDRYFHYAEELDLIERMRRAGWHLGLACRSSVRHAIGHSLVWRSPQSRYYQYRNGLLYYQRFHHHHPLLLIAHDVTLGVRGFLRSPRRPTVDRRNAIAMVLAAVDACRGRTGQRDLGPAYQEDRPSGSKASPGAHDPPEERRP